MVGKPDQQLVFIFLCARADPDGTADIHPSVIAALTGLPEDRVRAALHDLEQPDNVSRSPEMNGVRIERLDEHRDWGWTITNYGKYRSMKDMDTVRAQTRERVKTHRDKKRSVTHGNAPKRQAEAEAEAEELEADSKDRADARIHEKSPDNEKANLGRAVLALANGMDMNRKAPGSPLMDRVKRAVSMLTPEARKRIYPFAAWLAGKQGILDDELVLEFVIDAAQRLSQIKGPLFAYYAREGPAWNTVTGHHRANGQDRESERWKEEDRQWLSGLKSGVA